MKKLILFILLGITSLTISSCKKDDSTEDGTSQYYFRAKIDGQDYEADPRTVQAIFLLNEASITAKKELTSLNNIFALSINPFNGEGVYLTTDDSLVLHHLTYQGENDRWTATSDGQGIIEITKYDEDKQIIEGTFSFVGYSDTTGTTIQVTDGEFKAGPGGN